jgi:crotonobetainyl-CoA:carnitine CoA-transferase CaiB-like acyl-CoA transferase
MTRPLAGIRIVDLSRLLPGPFATQFLSDLGAEVVKIEDPASGGDGIRHFAPRIGGFGETQRLSSPRDCFELRMGSSLLHGHFIFSVL